MATCRECAYLRKCIDKATKEGYEHNVDFDPKDGCPGFGFKPNTAADTNADRIRAMSDEELAEFLSDDERACPPKWHNCRKHINECGGCWLEWLKQPAEV